ncbi:hypothetical protein SINU_05815 [Sporolactobacillus inulinus CASD]|uniref:Uncharacterized protein n=2 Tax=Sporolactobacillus inulinus TaxID=2078 RepID=A0A0U1QPW4_9BACL|nr:hypothetical protein SINU_05815 [Sporolactobacillus inulinus CASD]GEB75757.1 hypothetical protein SIN01_01020 [Sporolactobacillus inulinus]
MGIPTQPALQGLSEHGRLMSHANLGGTAGIKQVINLSSLTNCWGERFFCFSQSILTMQDLKGGNRHGNGI